MEGNNGLDASAEWIGLYRGAVCRARGHVHDLAEGELDCIVRTFFQLKTQAGQAPAEVTARLAGLLYH